MIEITEEMRKAKVDATSFVDKLAAAEEARRGDPTGLWEEMTTALVTLIETAPMAAMVFIVVATVQAPMGPRRTALSRWNQVAGRDERFHAAMKALQSWQNAHQEELRKEGTRRIHELHDRLSAFARER